MLQIKIKKNPVHETKHFIFVHTVLRVCSLMYMVLLVLLQVWM